MSYGHEDWCSHPGSRCSCNDIETPVKYYTILRGRPIGVEPVVYLNKPGDEKQDNPWAATIEEHDTMKDALLRVIIYNDTDEYLVGVEVRK